MIPWQQTLYEENRQGLFSLALAICRCPEVAEDAIHDAFLRIHGMPPPQVNARAYVFQAVRNSAIDLIRTQRREQQRNVSLFQSSASHNLVSIDPSQAIELAEQTQQIIDSLPQTDKEIIVLKIFADLTFNEVANIVGKSEKTVATQYRRTLIALRNRFQSQANQF